MAAERREFTKIDINAHFAAKNYHALQTILETCQNVELLCHTIEQYMKAIDKDPTPLGQYTLNPHTRHPLTKIKDACMDRLEDIIDKVRLNEADCTALRKIFEPNFQLGKKNISERMPMETIPQKEPFHR